MGYLERVFRATEEENRRAILAALPAGTGGALLDVGTHDGAFTQRVADRVGAERVAGIELMEDHAARAAARGFEISRADLEQALPFPNGSFDLVHANQVIEHVRATDVMLREIRRVLRPGGLACLSTNNLASWHNVLSLALGYQPPPMHVSDEEIVGNPLNPEDGQPHADRGQSHVRLFTARALVELCERRGLRPERTLPVGYYPLPPTLARLAVRVDPRHGAFVTVMARRE